MKALLITAAGLVTALAMLLGVATWTAGKAPKPDPGEWRPPCARTLGEAYAALDVEVDDAATDARVLLLGVDRSPSNREQSNEQLDAAAELASSLPVTQGIGILLVSDRSDRSSTPDLPFEPGVAPKHIRQPELPCGECIASGMFEQRCIEQVREALERRATVRQAELDRAKRQLAAERAARIERWRQQVADWWPRPGTSIVAFWRKVADLPVVRRSPEQVTVVLFGDLQEARTAERRSVERYARAVDEAGGCTANSPLEARLDGVTIVLLQTVVDRIDPRPWEARWTTVLECAGATVETYRYTPSVPLGEYLATRWRGEARETTSGKVGQEG